MPNPGPELGRLLRERLGESECTGVQSAWQGFELVWRVLRALVARMDLGGMGPLVARALDPRRMTLARKDAAGYGDVAIPFYERWAHRHEFLIRGQRSGGYDGYLPGLLKRLEEQGAGGLDERVSPGPRIVGPNYGAEPPDRRVGRRPRRGGLAALAVHPGRPVSRVVASTSFPGEPKPARGRGR